MMARLQFTSEAGLMGHPDKVADLIGDAMVDACLREDPESRVGCQVMTTNELVVIGGQITTNAEIDLAAIARDVVRDVGYRNASEGMSAETEILLRVTPQSREIASGVDKGGAGDSAIIIGYACSDTPELMPLSAQLVHAIAESIDAARLSGSALWLRPDGKIQASVECGDEMAPIVTDVVASVQHSSLIQSEARDANIWQLVERCIPPASRSERTRLVSRAGVAFTVGGPKADCGLSGRKVIADTYGGVARHGGGGLSGKDPTKIDRCGMYAARYIAKNLVAAGVAKRCEVELAFVIGHAEPVAISVTTSPDAELNSADLIKVIRRVFPLSPPAIIEALRLRRPVYRQASIYGHFGRTGDSFTWEACDLVNDVKAVA